VVARVFGLAASVPAQFNKRIRLFRSGGEDSARAMIFEAAADKAGAVRQQRGRQRIAGKSADLLAVKTPAQTLRAIDQPTAQTMRLVLVGESGPSGTHAPAL
jgi:hypothetical protein